MSVHEETKWIDRFVTSLESVRQRDDRAAMAQLRRGLTDHPAQCELWVFEHLYGAANVHVDSACLVAALFATHPQTGGRGTLGRAMRQILTDANSAGLERRLAWLMDSHSEDLRNRLPQIISLLRSPQFAIPVDWRRLLKDLIRWDDDKRLVQRQWARDFWSASSPGEADIPRHI